MTIRGLTLRFLILAVFGLSGNLFAQEVSTTPSFEGDTEVIASRIGTTPAEIGRRTTVIDREEIESLPVQTLPDRARL
jgi:hypothetical protein